MMKAKTACSKLAKVLGRVVKEYDPPSVKGPPDGWDQWTLCWHGPFEWTMVTAGSSVYAGESGRYSLPLEPAIEQVLAEIADGGWYFEPLNNCQMVPCKT